MSKILSRSRLFFIFSFIFTFFVADVQAFRFEAPLDMPSPPRLRYPVSDTVVLAGKESLEFRWWADFGLVARYEFRLFKGYNMYAKDLIYKEKLSARASSVRIKSELFEDGQVYTWSLIKVSLSGWKSDKSFSSFKVVKTLGGASKI